MFIKTLKYDFVFSRDTFFSMAAVIVALATVLRLTVLTPQPAGVDNNIMGTVFVVVIMLCGVLTVVQLMQFFHKNFFDDTGYLMFTLPQKRFPLFASKVVVSFVWLNFMLLSAISSVSILSASRFSLRGIIDAIDPRNTRAMLDIIGLLDFILIAMFAILMLFFVIALANSSLWRRRVNGLVSVAVGILYVWLYFWVYVLIGRRHTGLVLNEESWPIRQYNALGEYIGTECFYHTMYMRHQVVGLNVGRIPIANNGLLFFDIYRWGAGFVLCALAFFATYYLLKRRVSI